MAKEEGGEDEGSYLRSFLKNIVKNLEITLRNVVVCFF